ncbi:putative epoxidase LasC [Chlorella vulgaris]
MPSPRSVLPGADSGTAINPQLHAVVLGAGVAGLLAAHAAKQRRGIPQLAHPHTLAMGGLEAMDALLPGFEEELVRRGGVKLDLAKDLRFYDFGANYVRADSTLKSVGASRALIQTTLQDEVMRRNAGKLTVMDGCRVSGLLWDEKKTCVKGNWPLTTWVELRGGEELQADLVIVASGRTSCLPQWLKAAGHPVPAVHKVDAQLVYVGRMYEMPKDWDKKKWMGHITFGRPTGLTGAGMVPVEGSVWQMVEWGYNGVVPPMDEQAFLDFAASLPDKEIYNAISSAKALTPLCKHAGANNVQRCWDATPPPPGVLVIGDGVQALNPVYAQGMSVAAKSAECLGRVMQASVAGKASPEARRQAVRGMGPSFQKQLAAVVAPAWMMATSEDQRYPGTKVEGVAKPPRLLCLYIDALVKSCHHNAAVLMGFFEVAHLVRPPTHLFHPRMLAAGLKQMLWDAWQGLKLAAPSQAALKAE